MASDGRLTGKVALVTGAASGIGKATAALLSQHGASVVCADVDLSGASATAREIETVGARALALKLDVTSESDWQAVMSRLHPEPGRLDALINCAGISFGAPLADMSLDDWRRVFAVNVEGVFLGTKHALRAMRASGGGSIVNVASASGIRAAAGASAYSASKAAVIMFTKAAAKECAAERNGIRVNSVSPAGVKTPMWSTMPFFRELVGKTGSEDAAYAAMSEAIPGSRFADPMDIATAILYLASDESGFVTGADLVVDGGFTI